MRTMGELRCGSCSKSGLYSRVLLRFTIGAVAPGHEIVVRCRDCRQFVRLTTENQHCDGVNTFYVSQAAQMQAAQPQAVAAPPKEPSVSVSFKGELIPTETANAILDTAFNKDIPYTGAVQSPAPGNDRQELAMGESPAAGTEGMSPGFGLMTEGM